MQHWSSLGGGLAEIVQAICAVASLAVTIWIARIARSASAKLETASTLNQIYHQWMTKKKISLSSSLALKADWCIYDQDEFPAFDEFAQLRRVYMVMIIDVLFNSYVASLTGKYPEEVFRQDMSTHVGALSRYRDELLYLVRSRGYTGEGVLKSFEDLVMSNLRVWPAELPKEPLAARHALFRTHAQIDVPAGI